MHKRFVRLVAGSLMAATALALTACGSAPAGSSQPVQGPPPADNQIKVAVVWPFAAGGTLYWEGIQLALDEINGRGGITGYGLRLLKYDDQASVTEGMAVAQRLAADPTILAVIGHRNSFVAIPAADVYDRSGLIYIAPSPTNPTLTRRGYQRTFRTIPSDVAIGQQMTEHMAGQGHRRIALIYTDDAYGRGLADAFEDAAAALGVQVVDRLSHFGDLQETKGIVKRWRAMAYDAMFVSAVLPEAAEIISLIRQAGASMPIYGGDGLEGDQLWAIAGNDAEEVVFGSVFDPNDPDPRVQRFVKTFLDQYGRPPDAWAAQGYDALRLLARAIATAKTSTLMPTRAAVAEALHSTSGWYGVTGVHAFDETGELIGKPVVKKVLRAGQFLFLDK